ncbi:MAG TPA: 50S ribosomal protein L15 [Bacteroidia bacterium]|nr:50S ribosomal protein L15 [Bacteroidia bacterium]HNO70937.1 50S ribosomal protein L15 [Bacteroidia bacterium]
MELHTLKPKRGSVKINTKRKGRGQGSGKGGTSTKGHKGQQSDSGYNMRRGHEGGQMPLQRRLAKFGFTNIFRKEFHGINIQTLQRLADEKKISSFDIQTFIANGLVSKNKMVKILGNGELKSKVDVKAHAFSASAKSAIEAKGGKTEIVKA